MLTNRQNSSNVEISNFNSLKLARFSNLVLFKLDTVLYPKLAYGKIVLFESNSFQSLANLSVKINKNACVVAPLMDNMKYCCYISIKKFAICYNSNLPPSFENIAVEDKYIFSYCLENTKHTYNSKVFILWQRYFHCMSYK